MRTAILIVTGLVLAAAILRFTPSSHRAWAAGAFTVAWLGLSAWNLRVGLSHGYTLAEELPIHAALFGIPVAFAWAFRWWMGR